MWLSKQLNMEAYEAIPVISAKMPQAKEQKNPNTGRTEILLSLVGAVEHAEGRTVETRIPASMEAWIRMMGEQGEYRFLNSPYKKHEYVFTYYRNTETGRVEFFDMILNHLRHPNSIMTSDEVLDEEQQYMLRNTLILEVFDPEGFILVKAAPQVFSLDNIRAFIWSLRQRNGVVREQEVIEVGSFNVRIVRTESDGKRITARVAQRSRGTVGVMGQLGTLQGALAASRMESIRSGSVDVVGAEPLVGAKTE